MAVSRTAPPVRVLINGRRQKNARIHQVDIVSGGRRMNEMVFEVVQETLNVPTANIALINALGAGSLVEAFVKVRQVGWQRIHLGQLPGGEFEDSQRGETLTLRSRLEKHMFGNALAERPFLSPPLSAKSGVASARYTVASRHIEDWVFNPEIDGIPQPNKALRISRTRAGFAHFFVDPEGVDRATLKNDREKSLANPKASPIPGLIAVGLWTLQDVVELLCYWLNEREIFVDNPTTQQLSQIFPQDASLVRNLRVRIGTHLPQALDRVLHPYGYDWYVDFTPRKPQIRVYSRDSTVAKNIAFKRESYGKRVNDKKTNVFQQRLRVDATDRACNSVTTIGDFLEVEGTFELIPAWLEKYDTYTYDKLLPTDSDWEADDGVKRAHRDWVLNEAGDYIGLRSYIRQAFDTSKIFGQVTKRSRLRFFPTITLNNDNQTPIGQHRGIVVEYKLTGRSAAKDEWKPIERIPGIKVQILEDEAGIRLSTSGGIPDELYEHFKKYGAQQVKVRVTAALRSANRLVSNVTVPQFQSYIRGLSERIVDREGGYRWRQVLTSGPYASKFANQLKKGTLEADEANDLNQAASTSSDLIAKWNRGTLEGVVSIDGIDEDWATKIGYAATGIQPRNIGYETNLTNPRRYPIIVGLQFNIDSQSIRVRLDSFKEF